MRVELKILVMLFLSVALGATAYSAGEIHGTLSTHQRPDIYDFQLQIMINFFIPADNCHSTLIIFGECYGGDMMNDVADRPRTAVLSATSICQKARPGGYHDDAAKWLKPLPGHNSDIVHEKGIEGKDERETPQKQNPAVPLEPTDPDTLKSRHVVVYAGRPSRFDKADRDVIKANFAGDPNTTVTTVGGRGAPDGYDRPGTLNGLAEALKTDVGPNMNTEEQFILFVGDHGNKDVCDSAPDYYEGSWHSDSLTLPPSTYYDMQQDQDNIPAVILLGAGPVQPGPVTVQTSNEAFMNVTFDDSIDLNGDGDLEDEGEGWLAAVELNESLIDTSGEVITVSGEPDLNLSQICLESGAIGMKALCTEEIDKAESGMAVELEVVYIGAEGTVGNVAVTSNPPGCDSPTIEIIEGNAIRLTWPEPCVDEGELVQYKFTVDYPCSTVQPPYGIEWTYPIPTFTQWGLIILVVLIVLSTWVVLRRRKAAVSPQ